MTAQPFVKCTAAEAVERAASVCGAGGQYGLGTGDFRPYTKTEETDQGTLTTIVDLPWTGGVVAEGSDCAGFAICWCWKLTRHRPGFNKGSWATVEDDINCNSAIEDGLHAQKLFRTLSLADMPQLGDLLAYPTIELAGKTFVGHVCIVAEVPADYKPGEGWHRLTVYQCHGPNGFKPGVVKTDGAIWDHHDSLWPKTEHRTRLVRPRER